jgi:hypothetical protein
MPLRENGAENSVTSIAELPRPVWLFNTLERRPRPAETQMKKLVFAVVATLALSGMVNGLRHTTHDR